MRPQPTTNDCKSTRLYHLLACKCLNVCLMTLKCVILFWYFFFCEKVFGFFLVVPYKFNHSLKMVCLCACLFFQALIYIKKRIQNLNMFRYWVLLHILWVVIMLCIAFFSLHIKVLTYNCQLHITLGNSEQYIC